MGKYNNIYPTYELSCTTMWPVVIYTDNDANDNADANDDSMVQ